MQLADKIIIVTGASSGIGAAAARLFAREGAALVLAARGAERLAEVARDIAAAGGRVLWLAGDVDDDAFHRALVDRAEAEFGGLDGAFNNAGRMNDGRHLDETTPEDWEAVLRTNLTAGYFAARHQVPALKRRGGGSLVFTSSFVGLTATLPGMGAYAASKAGLNGLVQALAVENGPAGIRANALLPGGTVTGMAPADDAARSFIAGLHALKRMAQPDEIARAALFLLSDAASFVTGSAMRVDGGNSIAKV